MKTVGLLSMSMLILSFAAIPDASAIILSVKTDKMIYSIGDIVYVSGSVSAVGETQIVIYAINPYGETYRSARGMVQYDGTYAGTVELGPYANDKLVAGKWTIRVEYSSDVMETQFGLEEKKAVEYKQTLQDGKLGLQKDQWVKYRFSELKVESDNEELKEALANYFMGSFASSLNFGDTSLSDIDYITVAVKKVSGKKITTLSTIRTLDGKDTKLPQVTEEFGEPYFAAIPVNAKEGDKLYTFNPAEPAIVRGTVTKQIGNQKVEAFKVALSTKDVDQFTGVVTTFNIDSLYEKKTGILLDFVFSGFVADPEVGVVKFEFGMNAIEMSKPAIRDAAKIKSGLYEGQWVKYKFTEFKVESDNEEMESAMKETMAGSFTESMGVGDLTLDDIDWVQMAVTKISGDKFTTLATARTLDGKDVKMPPETVEMSEPYLLAIPTDTKKGDELYIMDESTLGVVEGTVTRNIGGQKVEVLRVTSTTQESNPETGGTFETSVQMLYDKKTGVMLGMAFSGLAADPEMGLITFEFGITAVDISKPSSIRDDVKGKAKLTVKAQQSGESVSVNVKSTSSSKAGVYSLQFTLSNGEAKSVKAPSGWTYSIDGNIVSLSTESKPLKPGKSLSFTISTDARPLSFSWVATDAGSELARGNTKATMKEEAKCRSEFKNGYCEEESSKYGDAQARIKVDAATAEGKLTYKVTGKGKLKAWMAVVKDPSKLPSKPCDENGCSGLSNMKSIPTKGTLDTDRPGYYVILGYSSATADTGEIAWVWAYVYWDFTK